MLYKRVFKKNGITVTRKLLTHSTVSVTPIITATRQLYLHSKTAVLALQDSCISTTRQLYPHANTAKPALA